MTKPTGERIASLEATMASLEKKVDTGFAEVKAEIKLLSAKIELIGDSSNDHFVSKKEFDEEIKEFKVLATTRLWQATVLTAALTALVTFLLTSYFLR